MLFNAITTHTAPEVLSSVATSDWRYSCQKQ